MSGLIALLDDVAAIAKVAAATLDDVATQAAKAGTKAAALVIDDAAVTPQYTSGFAANRELPIVWRIAKGSIKNKLLILLPLALLLSAFLPWLVTPLLMLGGTYLCFEGAEKVLHKFLHHDEKKNPDPHTSGDPAHLEEAKVAGAIKTDFILSAEIMTVSLATVSDSAILVQALVLVAVGIGVTVAVYGGVALIVKADDVGLHIARNAKLAFVRGFGRWIVRVMPGFMTWLTIIGTAAMLWVGGSIIIHGMHDLGFAWPLNLIHDWALAVAHTLGRAEAAVEWIVTAFLDGIVGLALGAAIVPLATKVIAPLWGKIPKLKV